MCTLSRLNQWLNTVKLQLCANQLTQRIRVQFVCNETAGVKVRNRRCEKYITGDGVIPLIKTIYHVTFCNTHAVKVILKYGAWVTVLRHYSVIAAGNMTYFTLFTCLWILKVSIIFCDDPDPCELRDAGLLSHPKECQLYYNCSLPVRRFKPWLGKHVMECTYPDVFDEKTLQCGDFLNVQCNSRETYDHACEYRNNMCWPKSNCKRCISDFSCNPETGSGHQCHFVISDPLMLRICPLLRKNACSL
ncbi:uncharacterized protein LOC132756843 [Ruditapes philippinarum]|uniref:uncharacterized protein LOC132756843 n=1 Tax=Ruditapes philippinarum TaxID=129788 RepID=UPI00295C23B4|nr:uncharacterized protein LOC132756843 [Ruditapes philippinarum]